MGLRLGAELVIAPSFSASGYWDDVRRYDCTFAYHVGTIARMLWNQPPRPDDGTHPLRVFMGGGMPPDIWEAFASRFNVRIIEGYAASDSVGTICNWGDAPAGSIGRPDPGVEVRVADTDDNDVAVGETGELLLRPAFSFGGPPVRYYNDDEATAEKNRGGWIRTGDLVRQDGDGNLFFVDRRKDVIRRRGVNLAPAEIERIVCGHPLIGECAALAVPSELGEDEIKLVVPRTDGLTVDEVVSFCSSALPGLMQPRYVELVDELPKTVTERVERYKLKQSWRTPATWDVAAGGYVTP
jgi:crotonobetaine/carnitine-CoA ligase